MSRFVRSQNCKPGTLRFFARCFTLATAVLLCGLLLMILPGCSHPKSSQDELKELLSAAGYPRIVALGGLAGQMIFSSPSVRKTGDGQWAIAVPIRLFDRETQPVALEYKFDYLNPDGSPMASTNSHWQYMNLPPNTQRYAQGQARIAHATDWSLTLRPAPRQNFMRQ